ncbi:hypothetical protein OG235_33985 [Streptomyces sp. NBC_00024]
MLLIHLDPAEDATTKESPTYRQTTFLTTLTCPPSPDEAPSPSPSSASSP